MKKSSKIILIAIIFLSLILISTNVFAGEQDINKLEYNVTLEEDGTAHIEEIWNVYISDTNTMFKTFKLKQNMEFCNPKVEELKRGNTKEFTDYKQYAYHLPENYYYGIMNDEGKYEIAWGVNLENDSDTRTYKISYDVKNAVKRYEDCSEFYWQFLEKNNIINCDRVIGTIKILGEVDSLDDLLVWAHGPLNGTIERKDKNTATFRVDNLNTKTMLETRIVVTNDKTFSKIVKTNKNKLQEIKSEEEKFANKANSERDALKRRRIVAIVGIIGIELILVINIFKSYKKYKKLSKNMKDIKYYREIPNEETTPSEAAYLFYYNESKFKSKTPEIISATIMNLLLKGDITFETNSEINDDTKIKLNVKYLSKLPYLEQRVYEIMEDSGTLENGTVYTTMNQFENYMNENSIKVGEKINSAVKETKNSLKNRGILTNKGINAQSSNSISIGITVILILISFVIMTMFDIPFGIILILITICIINNVIKSKTAKICIDEKANIEQAQWNGLYNYMNDYSLLKERKVLEIAIWEKFLVYATAFGIAKKVVEELKVEYPEYIEELERITYYTRMDRIIKSNVRRCNSDYHQSISASTSSYSSGSGFGGGFSSGGGGGRRRRKHGRKIKTRKNP